MDLNPLKDAFHHAFKKRKLCETTSEEIVGKVSEEIELAVKLISSTEDSGSIHIGKIISELQAAVNEIRPLNQIALSQRDLKIAITKCGKVVDKFFQLDIAKAQRDVDFDLHVINKIIVSHLYQLGRFDLGDCFMKEAQEDDVTLKEPFHEMYQIIEQLKMRNLEPAIAWAKAHCEELRQKRSSLEFNLHQLQFVQLLQQGLRSQALQYAKANFCPFSDTHMPRIQRLMGSVLWVGRLESSPYSDLSHPSNWNLMDIEFTRECCNLNGYSHQSALQITINAGAQALPTLLKMVSVLSSKKQDWLASKQLPVEVELDREYQFHSIFTCPVSKEQSSSENPPTLMPCGHVLCKQSLQKMSKSRAFKCPYCPTEIVVSQCKPICF